MSQILATDLIIESLRNSLPPVFNRKTVQEMMGHIINARTLANLDCQKKGPPRKYLSKNVMYERETFLAWLEPKLSDKEGNAL